MKITLTCIATAILAASAFSQFGASIESTHNYEQDIACTWFPICRDPDFQQESEYDNNDALKFQSQPELLISCTWFPICRDPDQPLVEQVAVA
jgi:hypothetical protein